MASVVDDENNISICRVCMHADPNLYPIFEVQTGFENSVADILTECTKYPAERNDKLPTNICLNCRELARNAHNFKRQTEEAYCRLKSVYDINWASQQKDENKGAPTTDATTIGGNSIAHKYTQTDKSTVFQCESCPLKFFAENELRQHRAASHIYDGKKCRVCGGKFNHLGQLKVHLSTAHPDEGIRCDFKCYICAREFTRKDHLKRHLIKVHKIKDEKLNISKVSLDEPEIQINTSDNQTTTLNNYSSHWPDYCNEDDDVEGGTTSQNETTEAAINPFSSDDEGQDQNSFNDMNDEDVKHFVENFPQPEVSIKVEPIEIMDNYCCPIDNEGNIAATPSIKTEAQTETENMVSSAGNIISTKQHDVYDKSLKYMDSNSYSDENDVIFMDSYGQPDDDDEAVLNYDDDHTVNKTKTRKGRRHFNPNKAERSYRELYSHLLPLNERTFKRDPFTNSFHCNVCSVQFKMQRNLRRHMLIHTDLRPFQCQFCEKAFKRKDNLQKHFREVHAEKPFKCTDCDKKFFTYKQLDKHLKTNRHRVMANTLHVLGN